MKIIEKIKKKWIKDTITTIIMVLILFAAFIGINILIQKLDLPDIDITENKLYTLSNTSIQQIQNIEDKVEIYLIGYSEDSALSELVKQYTRANENITMEVIEDITERADLISIYSLTDESQAIIVKTDDNSKTLMYYDLYTYNYTTYQQIDISEEKITNAIVDLTKEERPQIYFLTGHNEYSLTSELTMLSSYLTNEVNDVSSLDLLVTGEVPEDADLVIIGSPQKDFYDQEVEILTAYVNNGGKILWLNDPLLTGETFPNMQKILDLFGVTFEDGVVLEQDEEKMALQSPNYIIPDIATTNATKNIATDGGILFVNATKISLKTDEELEELNVTPNVILTTSDTAIFRKDLTDTSLDEEGSVMLGVELTKTIQTDDEEEDEEEDVTEETKQATLYVIANNFFVSDYEVTIGSQQVSPIEFYNNKDYILNTIAELTENEDVISIRKDTGVVTYIATEAEDNVIKIIITAFPIIIILIGIIVWIIRRRKK